MNMFKRTSRVIAVVLTLCMVFTMNSAVFAATAPASASDDTYTYVSLGASQTNGYGMRGYLDDEVYQNPDEFDKNTANVFGYERAPEAAYPSLLAKQLAKDTGKKVDLRQLAMSSMRAEEVRVLLDETYDGDDYTEWRFSAGHNWFDRAGGIDQLRAEYKDAVTKADLITVEVGVNNFGVYAINQLLSGGEMFDTDLAEIAAPDKMKTYNMIKDVIKPMIAGAAGVDEATVDLLADTFSYAYVGYKTSFDAIIAKIRELNPDTKIVVLGIPNMMAGVEAEMNGTPLPLGELFGTIVDLGNLYASTESPYVDEYFFASTGEAATFLEEVANYNGDPASLSVNMKDCFDVYDDDLRIRSNVKAALKGYKTTTYNKALNNAYDVVATVMQAGAKNNVIDLGIMLSGDTGAAEDAVMAYIAENVNAGIAAAKKLKSFNFKFDESLMEDPAIATVMAMGVRSSIGNSFFAHPSEIGHQEVADAILEAIDFETTGQEAAAAEMSAAMNDMMAMLLEVSPVMFDSQKQIVNKLKVAVNDLDSYAKAEMDKVADLREQYSKSTKMKTVMSNVASELDALRKEIKTVKNNIVALSTAINDEDAVAVEEKSAVIAANMDDIEAAAADLNDDVRAAVKKARELKLDYAELKTVAAEMSSYISLAYATTGIMRGDARDINLVVEDDFYYVALGDGSTSAYNAGNASAINSYGRKLNAELGFNSSYRQHFANKGVKGMRVEDLLYILDEEYEPDAYGIDKFGDIVEDERTDSSGTVASIKKADLITVGFSNNTMLDVAYDQLYAALYGKPIAAVDWSRYLDEDSAAEITATMDKMEDAVLEATAGMTVPGINMENIGKGLRAAIENYVYSYLGFFKNYQTLVNKIDALNPDAEIILVGQFNPFEGTTLTMEGEELPMGEYMAYLTDLMNLQLRGYAMMTGKAIYVEADDVTIDNDDFAGNVDMMSFMVGLITSGTSGLYADKDSHTYIAEQLRAAMNLVDADTKAAMDKMAGLYDLVNISTTGKISAAEKQIKAARSAYDALTDAQKATVDADLLKLLEFYESDFDYVKALAVANSSVPSVKAKLATKTKLSISWSGVTGATGYTVKIYRNNALLKTVNVKSTTRSYAISDIYRGCTYKVTVAPINEYNGTIYTGKAKSYSVVSKLDQAKPTVKKSGSKVTIKSADQNSYGFQVRISKDKNFKKGTKTYSYYTAKKGLSKVLKLTTFKKGTNYVQVRAYTKLNGKISYGAWSARKTVKR